jgi:hypothetical protein
MPNGAQGDGVQAVDDVRKSDYAIIVGITRYPQLSLDGASADLKGPIHDAEKVRAWIESDEGGGVPSSHVKYVIRESPVAATPDPTRDAVVQAFIGMYAWCYPNGADSAPEIPLGRRLYVYVSGHGLAADLDHGALLCSNSSNNGYSTVAPYASIKAFRQMGFFKEFVVWFDGCMDWAGLEPELINYVPRPTGWVDPGPVFVAYAARPRLKAMESPDEKGEVGGVFTRTLLAGLEGRAVDPATGMIEGSDLAKYLWNAMPDYMPASAKDNVLISKQPFVRTEPGIFFGTTKKKNETKFAVVLRFTDAQNGAHARVWGRKSETQQSLSLLDERTIVNGQVELALGKGIYAVDVPEHGLRASLEVTGSAVTKFLPI